MDLSQFISPQTLSSGVTGVVVYLGTKTITGDDRPMSFTKVALAAGTAILCDMYLRPLIETQIYQMMPPAPNNASNSSAQY